MLYSENCMETFPTLGINFLLLIGVFFTLYKNTPAKYALVSTLLSLLTLLSPLFHYQPPQLIFISLPFLTLLILIIIIKNKYKGWILSLGCLYILVASLFISGIITWPFHFQIDHTILADKHISDAILQHQQDALYLPFKLRPVLFNSLVYLYSLLTHASYFLSFSNLYNIFLLANLYPLIIGSVSLMRNNLPVERFFIMGGIAISVLVVGFSRSIQEMSVLFVASPLFIYLILTGLRKVNVKLYLALLAFSFAIKLNILL